MQQPIYNLDASKQGELKLAPAVFDVPMNYDLVHRVAVSLSSNRRRPIAHTKTKGEVRGGGKKPWSQKGTGNARAGSIRSPIFKGGGVTFGPRNEVNFQKKINKKERKKAFVEVLSSKLRDGELKIIESFKLETPKTKKLADLFKKLGTEGKSGLVVTLENNDQVKKSLANLPRISFAQAANICSLDLLNYKFLYLEKAVVGYYEKKYATVEVKKSKK
ncbi:MAG: 50S ribosomal protein L4 [Patescibacteria group bacterium]|nr:50S ribosomal protein L4 [Patescibacteria group bacterium]